MFVKCNYLRHFSHAHATHTRMMVMNDINNICAFSMQEIRLSFRFVVEKKFIFSNTCLHYNHSIL
jgi:hypothetical protein